MNTRRRKKSVQCQHKWSEPWMGGPISRFLFRGSFSVTLLLAFWLADVNSSKASMVERFTLENLVQKSPKILIGRCLSTESRWNAKKTLIFTYSNFAVNENLKGQPADVVTVVTIGGTVDGITQQVAGMPLFIANQEALLFLEPSAKGNWQTLALSLGHFKIVRDPATGAQEAVHNLAGLQIYNPVDHSVTTEEIPSHVPLDQLVRRIRTLMQTN
jgi:hypothetical protein